MSRFLPFTFLASIFSLFGIVWIIWDVDPTTRPWKFFALLTALVFIFVWGFLGTLLYFLRTRIYRKYSANWYFYTSFKMAFFVALFIAICAFLAVLQLVNLFNVILAILAVSLFAFWSFLGKH